MQTLISDGLSLQSVAASPYVVLHWAVLLHWSSDGTTLTLDDVLGRLEVLIMLIDELLIIELLIDELLIASILLFSCSLLETVDGELVTELLAIILAVLLA